MADSGLLVFKGLQIKKKKKMLEYSSPSLLSSCAHSFIHYLPIQKAHLSVV